MANQTIYRECVKCREMGKEVADYMLGCIIFTKDAEQKLLCEDCEIKCSERLEVDYNNISSGFCDHCFNLLMSRL